MDDERKLAKNKHLQANELFLSQFSEMCRKYCVYKKYMLKIYPNSSSESCTKLTKDSEERRKGGAAGPLDEVGIGSYNGGSIYGST